MIHSSHPQISVIICTYNRSAKLRNALVSLAQMSVPSDLAWELVVVDNNSSDDTKHLVDSFVRDSSLNAKYVLERTAGLSHARNRGLSVAEGEVISFLDDDVVVAPNWLVEILKAFEQHDVMCVGGRVLLQALPSPVPSWWNSIFDGAVGKFDKGDNVIVYEKNSQALPGIGANMSFRRVVFDRYGTFCTELGRIGRGLGTGEEINLAYKLLRNNEVTLYYPGAVVYHCVSTDRFSKQYLRQIAWHLGVWRYLEDSETSSNSPSILGVPRWVYKSIPGSARWWIYLTFTSRQPEAFLHEYYVISYLGYFAAAWKAARSGGTHRGRNRAGET